MAKNGNESELPIPEIPTIEKIVDCPNCGAKIKVEFEIELAPLLPMALAGGMPTEEKEADDKS